MIPDFYDGLNLPPGGHECTWNEVKRQFCEGAKRQHLCIQLNGFLERAKNCGFLRVAIGGSFATAKTVPGDLDLLFIVPRGITKDTVAGDCVELLDTASSRRRFGHDFMYCNDEPQTVKSLIFGLGFDMKTRCDRGMLIIDLNDLEHD